jgi:hypothetical protein
MQKTHNPSRREIMFPEVVNLVRFQVLTATSMEMAVFWDVPPCSLVDIDRRSSGAYYPDDGGRSTSETSVNIYQTTWNNITEDSHLQVVNLPSSSTYKLYVIT